jgi:hypothetical protein
VPSNAFLLQTRPECRRVARRFTERRHESCLRSPGDPRPARAPRSKGSWSPPPEVPRGVSAPHPSRDIAGDVPCARNLPSLTPPGAQKLRRGGRVTTRIARITTVFHARSAWHDIRLHAGHGAAVRELRTEVPCPERAVPRRLRSSRDLPRRDGSPARPCRTAAIRRAGFSRVRRRTSCRPGKGIAVAAGCGRT